MLHLFETPRTAIDSFEQTLINAFSSIPTVDAIWVRETPNVDGGKKFVRHVWVILARHSPGTVQALQARFDEIDLRTNGNPQCPFGVAVDWLVDDLPPAVVAPSCVWRRQDLRR